jgi:hypothetical protein
MYRPTIHRRRDHNFSYRASFPVREANLIEIENQFGYTALYMFVQIPHDPLQKRSRDLQTLLLLWCTFCLDDVTGMTKEE